MRKIKLILLAVIGVLCAPCAQATHAFGSEITYKYIDTLKYEVTLSLYRDCRGISMPNAGNIVIRCTNGLTTYDTLSLSYIESILPICPSFTDGCSPQNTTASGEGIEKHVYIDTIDFNQAPLSSLASCTGKIIISSSINARNGAITTGPSGTLYNYTSLDLANAPINSSPVFTTPVVGILCCSHAYYHNFGVLDASDNDSFSYSFAAPLRAYNTPVTYSGSYSPSSPFTAYDPRPSGGPPIPSANPPIGLYLDPISGDFIFTPVGCSEVAVTVIEVKEWRKNSSGVYQEIGKIRRDMQYIVRSCTDNNPPKINGPYVYNACEGNQLCFNITTEDAVYVPPPPFSPGAPDTVTLSWNSGIPGATFTIINPTARLQTGRFCWTPPEGSAQDLPYQFTTTAMDDQCPLRAVTTRGFRVKVKPRAKTTPVITKLASTQYEVKSAIDSASFRGTPVYSWTLLDSSQNIVFDRLTGVFQSTEAFLSSRGTDTILLNRNNIYIVQHTINNAPLNCPKVYYDTITVDSILETLIQYPKDTLVCAGNDITLSTTTIYNQGAATYQWYKNDTTLLIGDTLSTLSFNYSERSGDNTYSVVVSDAAGQTNLDKVRIRSKDNFDNSFALKYDACIGENITLQLDTIFTNILWNDGSTDSIRNFTQSLTPWVSYEDSFNCSYSDSIELVFLDLPQPVLKDSSTCEPNLSISAGSFAYYLWNTSQVGESISVSTSGNYSVTVTDTNGCQNADTAAITFWVNPDVNLGDDSAQCSGSITLSNNTTRPPIWSTGDTSDTILVYSSGTYSIVVTDTNGCQDQDSIEIDIYTIPTQSWADTMAICTDTGTSLYSAPFSGYLWSTGDTTQSIYATTSGVYALYFEDNQGCSNSDSIYVILNALPDVSLGNDTAFCGDSLLLALAPGNSFVWSSGDTLNFSTINTSGDYWVQITNSNGCSATDTLNISFLQNTIPPVLSRNADTILSNKTGTHQWFKDQSLITGATGNYILHSGIGSYTAVHLDSNGCISDTSNTIAKTLAVEKVKQTALRVYPNPANGKVTIDATSLGTVYSVKLYDNLGKLVEHSQSKNGALIDLSWTTRSGVLWVVVETENGVYRAEVLNIR